MILILRKTTIKKSTINQKKIIMKKTIVYLGVALVAFTNVSLASNFNSLSNDKITVSVYEDVSPLCIAISKGDVESVKKIIEYGADVNEKSNGMTPLMFAARYNKVEILKFLVSKGAKITAKDEKGFTALKYAELSNAFDAIQYLKQV
jgi:ankyrin repeat protein